MVDPAVRSPGNGPDPVIIALKWALHGLYIPHFSLILGNKGAYLPLFGT